MSKTRFHKFFAKVRQFAAPSRFCLTTLALLSASFLCALAQDGHSHMETTTQQQQPTPQQTRALIKIVRESTERFKDVSVAEAEGYALQFGCVSGPDSAWTQTQRIQITLLPGLKTTGRPSTHTGPGVPT